MLARTLSLCSSVSIKTASAPDLIFLAGARGGWVLEVSWGGIGLVFTAGRSFLEVRYSGIGARLLCSGISTSMCFLKSSHTTWRPIPFSASLACSLIVATQSNASGSTMVSSFFCSAFLSSSIRDSNQRESSAVTSRGVMSSSSSRNRFLGSAARNAITSSGKTSCSFALILSRPSPVRRSASLAGNPRVMIAALKDSTASWSFNAFLDTSGRRVQACVTSSSRFLGAGTCLISASQSFFLPQFLSLNSATATGCFTDLLIASWYFMSSCTR
mmetsp:Transcript_498/g.871  ORF Transcript_498/g.871 Transcript_498/m.871 type:complete len:272 (+) Transcript_498:972-1787(+)